MKKVLLEKYGDSIRNLVEVGEVIWPSLASRWWKDLMSLEEVVGSNWFNEEVSRKVGNDLHTSFWKDIWVGSSSLYALFPRFFSISIQKDAKVSELWYNDDGRDTWRRTHFLWECEQIDTLPATIGSFSGMDEEDAWI